VAFLAFLISALRRDNGWVACYIPSVEARQGKKYDTLNNRLIVALECFEREVCKQE